MPGKRLMDSKESILPRQYALENFRFCGVGSMTGKAR
jgi:hypothetical protein